MAHQAPSFRSSGVFLVLAWAGVAPLEWVVAETGIGWRVRQHAELTQIVGLERTW
jgi:hypothetical protein